MFYSPRPEPNRDTSLLGSRDPTRDANGFSLQGSAIAYRHVFGRRVCLCVVRGAGRRREAGGQAAWLRPSDGRDQNIEVEESSDCASTSDDMRASVPGKSSVRIALHQSTSVRQNSRHRTSRISCALWESEVYTGTSTLLARRLLAVQKGPRRLGRLAAGPRRARRS